MFLNFENSKNRELVDERRHLGMPFAEEFLNFCILNSLFSRRCHESAETVHVAGEISQPDFDFGPDKFIAGVDLYMVLVPVIVLSILLDPFCVGVLLVFLVVAPVAGDIPVLYLLIFVTAVALFRRRHYGRVYYLAFPRAEALFPQETVELFKEFFLKAKFAELLPEKPYRLGVGHSAVEVKVKKTHERNAVFDLVLKRIVREVVEGLQNEDLEHQHHIERLASGTAFPFLFIYLSKFGTELLPWHKPVKFYERIAAVAEFLQSKINIKKSIHHLNHLCSVAGSFPAPSNNVHNLQFYKSKPSTNF